VVLGQCRRRHEESAGSWSTFTVQALSRFSVAWSWEGRSIVKLPNSSVVANAESATGSLGPSVLQSTATLAPGSDKYTIHQQPDGKVPRYGCNKEQYVQLFFRTGFCECSNTPISVENRTNLLLACTQRIRWKRNRSRM